MPLFKSSFHSPVGKIGLLADDADLISLSFTDFNFLELEAKKTPDRFEHIILQLNQYFFEGRKSFDFKYKLQATDFQLKVYEEMLIPSNFYYKKIKSISNEGREKLMSVLPETIGQAQRIPGIRPTDISILLVYLKRSFHVKHKNGEKN